MPEELMREVEIAISQTENMVEKEEEFQKQYYSISLEKDLAGYLAKNPWVIEKGLQLVAREKQTPVGRIDLLLKDKNGLVVVETKKGKSSDKVVGQILRYIGWMKSNQNKDVRGIIIVGEPDGYLDYAVEGSTNLSIKYYRVQFEINDDFA